MCNSTVPVIGCPTAAAPANAAASAVLASKANVVSFMVILPVGLVACEISACWLSAARGISSPLATEDNAL
jgi:hypothetical protein